MMNQTIFTKLLIIQDGVAGAYLTQLFADLMSQNLIQESYRPPPPNSKPQRARTQRNPTRFRRGRTNTRGFGRFPVGLGHEEGAVAPNSCIPACPPRLVSALAGALPYVA
jgi:hypothetical protein